jgi:hypothetical protein
MRFQHLDRWRHTAESAYGAAERPTFSTFKWNVAGSCESPIYREYYGAEARGAIAASTHRRRGPQMTMEFHVRCRECPSCLRSRAAHWRLRAVAEIRDAPRTWFGTLTFRPEIQYRATCAVSLRLVERGSSFAELSEATKFRLIANELAKEITKYIKRLRKAGASLRYVVVAEAHKSGMPHFHMLAHEVTDQSPVRHKLLAEKWIAGFSQWKLVDGPAAAHYVTKYLTKSVRAQIRASIGYGQTSLDIPTKLGETPLKNGGIDPQSVKSLLETVP